MGAPFTVGRRVVIHSERPLVKHFYDGFTGYISAEEARGVVVNVSVKPWEHVRVCLDPEEVEPA